MEVTTWGALTTGDRIVFGDPATVCDVARQGRRFAVRPRTQLAGGPAPEVWSEPFEPPPDLAVGRLYRSDTSAVVEILRAAGLAPDIIN